MPNCIIKDPKSNPKGYSVTNDAATSGHGPTQGQLCLWMSVGGRRGLHAVAPGVSTSGLSRANCVSLPKFMFSNVALEISHGGSIFSPSTPGWYQHLLVTAPTYCTLLGCPTPCQDIVNCLFITFCSYHSVRACHLVPAEILTDITVLENPENYQAQPGCYHP